MEQLLETLHAVCDKIAISKETDCKQATELVKQLRSITDSWEVDLDKQQSELADKQLMKNMFPYYWLLKESESVNQ